MKQHRFAIILAVVIALIVGLPHILIPKIIAPEKYDPLQFNSDGGSSITMEEVYTYVPEVREILEGKSWVTDTQVAEYNGRPTPFAGETGLAWIMAALVKLTGSMQNAFMAADFLFPAVTFLLVYAIVLAGLTRPVPLVGIRPPAIAWRRSNWRAGNDGRFIAAVAGVIVVLWPELVALFPYPQAVVSSIKSVFNPRDFLFISRNFHPQLSLPAYLFAVWSLLRSDLAVARSDLSRTVISGLAVGFLFYTYIFNWTAFGLGFALFFLLILLRTLLASARRVLVIKRFNLAAARLNLMKLLIIFAVAGLVAAPYIFQIWEFRQSGLAEDFFLKLSLPKRGFFDLTARHWVFVLMFLAIGIRNLWFRNQESPDVRQETPELKKILFLSFWIAPLLMPDIAQAVFGRDLEGKHWVRRIGYSMSIMGLGLIAGEIKRKWVNAAAGLILLAALGYGTAVQVNMSRKVAAAYAVDKDKQELYEFINTKFPPGSVIASLDWETIVDIPAKTHAFNFSPIGMRTVASTDETLDRFLWAAVLYGKNEEWVREAFGENGVGTTRVYYFMYADDEAVFRAPQDKVEEILSRYKDIQQRFAAGEKPLFRLDYVLIRSGEKLMLQSVR